MRAKEIQTLTFFIHDVAEGQTELKACYDKQLSPVCYSVCVCVCVTVFSWT